MLWYNQNQQSNIDKLLSNSDQISLEQLLVEEDLIDELRNTNPKLLDYFHNNTSCVEKLIEYITVEPTDLKDEMRCYKYPYVSAEIFECEITQILQMFFQNEQKYFEQLFKFPLQEKINDTLAGLFSKTVIMLLGVRPRDVVEYIYSNKEIFSGLVKHIASKHIADIVHSLFIIENGKYSESESQSFGIQKILAIQQIFEKFDTMEEEEVQNFCVIAADVVNKYFNIMDGESMTEAIMAKGAIKKMFKMLFQDDQSRAKSASNLLLAIAQHYHYQTLNYQNHDINSEFYQIMQEKYEELPFFQEIVSNMDKIAQLLQPDKLKAIGILRLKIIKILEVMMKVNQKSIENKVIELHVLDYIICLFFKFDLNNIFQYTVQKILFNIFENQRTMQNYLQNILNNNFLQKLVLFCCDPDDMLRTRQKGNIGHILIIANKINNLKQQNSIIQDHINSEWEEFTQNVLETQNLRQGIDLGNFEEFKQRLQNQQYDDDNYYNNNQNYSQGFQQPQDQDIQEEPEEYEISSPVQTNKTEINSQMTSKNSQKIEEIGGDEEDIQDIQPEEMDSPSQRLLKMQPSKVNQLQKTEEIPIQIENEIQKQALEYNNRQELDIDQGDNESEQIEQDTRIQLPIDDELFQTKKYENIELNVTEKQENDQQGNQMDEQEHDQYKQDNFDQNEQQDQQENVNQDQDQTITKQKQDVEVKEECNDKQENGQMEDQQQVDEQILKDGVIILDENYPQNYQNVDLNDKQQIHQVDQNDNAENQNINHQNQQIQSQHNTQYTNQDIQEENKFQSGQQENLQQELKLDKQKEETFIDLPIENQDQQIDENLIKESQEQDQEKSEDQKSQQTELNLQDRSEIQQSDPNRQRNEQKNENLLYEKQQIGELNTLKQEFPEVENIEQQILQIQSPEQNMEKKQQILPLDQQSSDKSNQPEILVNNSPERQNDQFQVVQEIEQPQNQLKFQQEFQSPSNVNNKLKVSETPIPSQGVRSQSSSPKSQVSQLNSQRGDDSSRQLSLNRSNYQHDTFPFQKINQDLLLEYPEQTSQQQVQEVLNRIIYKVEKKIKKQKDKELLSKNAQIIKGLEYLEERNLNETMKKFPVGTHKDRRGSTNYFPGLPISRDSHRENQNAIDNLLQREDIQALTQQVQQEEELRLDQYVNNQEKANIYSSPENAADKKSIHSGESGSESKKELEELAMKTSHIFTKFEQQLMEFEKKIKGASQLFTGSPGGGRENRLDKSWHLTRTNNENYSRQEIKQSPIYKSSINYESYSKRNDSKPIDIDNLKDYKLKREQNSDTELKSTLEDHQAPKINLGDVNKYSISKFQSPSQNYKSPNYYSTYSNLNKPNFNTEEILEKYRSKSQYTEDTNDKNDPVKPNFQQHIDPTTPNFHSIQPPQNRKTLYEKPSTSPIRDILKYKSFKQYQLFQLLYIISLIKSIWNSLTKNILELYKQQYVFVLNKSFYKFFINLQQSQYEQFTNILERKAIIIQISMEKQKRRRYSFVVKRINSLNQLAYQNPSRVYQFRLRINKQSQAIKILIK